MSNELQSSYRKGDRDFSERDFRNANLSYQILSGSDFQSSDFSSANLSGAMLVDCDFRNANLAFSNLSNANLTGANLTGTNLEGATITTATLEDSIYSNATVFPHGINPENLGAINLDAPPPEPAPIVEIESVSANVEQQSFNKQVPEIAQKRENQSSTIPETPKTKPPSAPPQVPIEYRVTPIETQPPYKSPKTSAFVGDTSPGARSTPPKSAPDYSYTNNTATTTTSKPPKKNKNGIIALSSLVTLTVGYCMSRSITPTGIGGLDEAVNQFESVRFPLGACGDPMPTNSSDFPVNLYPVFIDYSAYNLQTVTRNYCADAYRNNRANGTRAIQVASFTSRDRAQDFADFMRERLGSGDVGQPNTFYR